MEDRVSGQSFQRTLLAVTFIAELSIIRLKLNRTTKTFLTLIELIKCVPIMKVHEKLYVVIKKVLLHFMDIVVHNAFIIYCKRFSAKIKFLKFREHLINSLTGLNDKKHVMVENG